MAIFTKQSTKLQDFRYDPSQHAGKLQQLGAAELRELVAPQHREEQPTAMVYTSKDLEQTVQLVAPTGLWESFPHVDHYTLGQSGSERLLHLERHLVFIARPGSAQQQMCD